MPAITEPYMHGTTIRNTSPCVYVHVNTYTHTHDAALHDGNIQTTVLQMFFTTWLNSSGWSKYT